MEKFFRHYEPKKYRLVTDSETEDMRPEQRNSFSEIPDACEGREKVIHGAIPILHTLEKGGANK